MSAEYFDVLRKMPVFGGLSDSSLMLITESGREVGREAGEYFFCEGDNGDSLYILHEGQVLVQRNWQGSDIILSRLTRGDCFGEMSLIDLMPRSASVRAETYCLALEVAQTCLYHLYKQDLEQYAILMMNMGREVSRRLRKADERLFAIEQKLPAFRA